MSDLICRRTTIDEIYELRFAVLRPGLTLMKLHFVGDGDEPPRTWHFGAFMPGRGEPVGCLTLFASEWEGRSAIQLRGMAVAAEWRGTGVGTKLLQAAEEEIAAHAEARMWTWWCNARVEAVEFYERNGWRVVSEEFVIEGVGPHRKMVRG